MKANSSFGGVHPLWWTAGLFTMIAVTVVVCAAFFNGVFVPSVRVTLTSDRSGLVMETGAKVKLNGVEVGHVAGVSSGTAERPVSLKLEILSSQLKYLPANVGAEIRATTAFGAKYVDLIYPEDPSPQRLSSGDVIRSRNVSIEVNTVFQNLVVLLKQVDVSKLNATLTALADGFRGQGDRIGQATTAANEVLQAINPRMGTVAQDWRSLKKFSDAYSAAAQDILATLDAASTTSATITEHAKDLDTLLLSAVGFAQAGTKLLGPAKDDLVSAVNTLRPTADLLMKYNPEYTCLLVGAKYYLDHGGFESQGGNGRSLVADGGLLFGADPYRYPENLPIVAAKGGPGGTPGCGSLPDVTKNFPVRALVTNTGWGDGLDYRPNPGIGHPCWVDYLPVTRAVPEPPSIRDCLPGPAPGPIPYPGAPPYGAPMYGPGGVPLYPGVPPAVPQTDGTFNQTGSPTP